MALSETGGQPGGQPGGQFESESDSVANHRREALDNLQRAWKSLRTLESLSVDPTPGRLLEIVSDVLSELERMND